MFLSFTCYKINWSVTFLIGIRKVAYGQIDDTIEKSLLIARWLAVKVSRDETYMTEYVIFESHITVEVIASGKSIYWLDLIFG